MFSPAFLKFARTYLERALSGFATQCEAEIPRDGKTRWVNICYTPDLADHRGVVVFANYIRASKRFRSLARDVEQILVEILECIPDGVFTVDRNWSFTYLNSRAEAALQSYKPLIGRNLWSTFPEAEGRQFGSSYRKTMSERVATEFEEFYPDPLNRWYEVHAHPFRDGIVVFFRDITTRRSTETLKRLFEQTVAAVPLGITITRRSAELDDPIIYANAAFERITGYSNDEVVGRNCRFLQGDDREQPERKEIQQALETGGTSRLVIRNYRKDRTQFFNELHLSPIRELDGTVSHFVGIQTDITERVKSRALLSRQAQFDSLTGIPNRYRFNEILERTIMAAQTSGDDVSVIYLDLDNLKYVNDSLGHIEGDALLKRTAERIVSEVRDSDRVARLGGDEFAVVCTGVQTGSALSGIMQRITSSISAPLMLGNREIVVTASAGAATYPRDAQTPEELLRKADLAMYAAKRESKNTWRTYSPALHEVAQKALEIASDLRRAIIRRELFLVYQPRVDATTKKLSGMEALVRWNHPEQGTLLPGRFIQIAEETGLINMLGEWVLNEALAQGRRWLNAGLSIVPLSVNVSPVQVRNPGFNDMVSTALNDTDWPAHQLEIEVTESVMLDASACELPLRNIRAMGIRLALDDFGTGFSALSYLKHFKMDTLKIDRSFISSIDEEESAAICRAVLGLTRELKMKSVAEGIEHEDQAIKLASWGCEELQGFHLGRPMLPAEMEMLIRKTMRAS